LALCSVSRHCVRHAACPVAVVSHRPPAPADRRAVVVGVDGSAGAERALRWALDEASSLEVPVRALFCWQDPPVGGFLPGPVEGYRARAEEVVATATARAAAWRPDVVCRVEACVGAPADVLLEAAATASLLVLGSRPPHDLHDLLGSVAEQCSRASACPLVVVRGRRAG
ncbi:MAG: universal stress protein, partial [Acidimicrobiales bacterium]